jgi:hypothetical protein
MNRDLFLSILALDSYNRGYGQRVSGLANTGLLGNARIKTDSIVEFDSAGGTPSQDADFYAVAYTYNGETIISYRGTDNLVKDAISGYGVGAGIAGVPQGDLAIAFYQNVTGQNIFNANVLGNVVLTGHSLGGGLAGLVSTLTGVEAVGYDYMPFANAANDNLIQEMAA